MFKWKMMIVTRCQICVTATIHLDSGSLSAIVITPDGTPIATIPVGCEGSGSET
ncbi:hypothetical protein IC619_000690 [Hazenella sp. IB182353]|uniref:hypothetical protein n=1 Tax=Polycladospora coralii TaxID=2771432 RepID=UPI001746875A|nr:hypothetical protein [Polycladospora coralii]MBS7529008.1 hypothetical protein [Polycladospora coralii]